MRLSKKNKKKVIIAAALGVLATLGIFGSMNSKQAALQEQQRKLQELNTKVANLNKNPFQEQQKPVVTEITAVVAARDINVGDTFTMDLLEEKEFPKEDLPEGYFKTTALLVGKKSGKNLVKGQFITNTEIQAEDIASIEIPNDMRAISIPTERFRGLASHIRVGSTVDLLKVGTPPEFIAQKVRIVAFEAPSAGGTSSRYNARGGPAVSTQYLSANQASAITFLVSIDLVQKVIDNMFEGQMQIIARNSSDENVVITEKELPPPPEENKTSSNEIAVPNININIPEDPIEEQELEPPSLPEAKPKRVELISGIDKSTYTFKVDKEAKEKDKKDEDSAYDPDLTKLLDMVE